MKNLVRILIALSLMTSIVSAYDKPGQPPNPKPIILKPSTKDYVFGPTTDGSSLSNLNASQLTSGTVPLARFPSSIVPTSVQTFSDTDVTMTAGKTQIIQIGNLTAPRTVTLVAANSVIAGYMMEVYDNSGTVTATNSITIARAGADTIDGATSASILSAYGRRILFSDGTSKWTYDASIARLGATNAFANTNTFTSPSGGASTPVTIVADAAQSVYLMNIKDSFGGVIAGYTASGVMAPLRISRGTKPAPTVSSISYNDPVITVTTTGDHGLCVDDPVGLSGITPTTFNSNYTVATTPTSTTFTINNANSAGLGAYVSGGAVTSRAGIQFGAACPLPGGAVSTAFTASGNTTTALAVYPASASQSSNPFYIADSFNTIVLGHGANNATQFTSIRPLGAVAATISTVAYSAGTVTLTFAARHGISKGRTIILTYVTNTILNGGSASNLFTVATAPTPFTLTYALPTIATKTVSNVVGDGTTATLTTSAAHGLSTGSFVTITGLTNTGFNVSNVQVTAIGSTTTFSFLNGTNLVSTADSGTVTLQSVSTVAESGTCTTRAMLQFGAALNEMAPTQADNMFTASAIGLTPIAISPFSSGQTADLFDCYDSASNKVFKIALGGITTIAPTTDAAILTLTQQTNTPASTAVGLKLTLLSAGNTVQLGSLPGTPSFGAITLGNQTPSNTVNTLIANTATTALNAPTTVQMRVANAIMFSVNATNAFMGAGVFNPFKSANVASTATMPAPIGNLYHVTGTTGITAFTSTGINAGTTVTWIFDGIVTVTSSTGLYMAGGTNYTSAASDSLTLTFDGTNWFETGRGKASSGAAFSAITAGTNTAALLVGAGGSFGPTSTGTITATTLASDANSNVKGGASALNAISSGSSNVCIGNSSGLGFQTATNNVCLGWFTMSSTRPGITGNTAIGYNTLANSGGNLGAGQGNYNTALGYQAGLNITDGTDNTMLGRSTACSNTANGQISIGSGATCTATAQFVAGSTTFPATDVYFGQGVTNASSAVWTLNGVGGSGSNNAGNDFYAIGGRGTGTAADGRFGIKYPLLTTTGSTIHTVSTMVSVPSGTIYTATATTTLTASTATTGTIIGAQTGVTPAGTLTIDANAWRPGRRFKVCVRGLITTSAAGPTLKVDIKLGSTVVATSGAVAPISSITNGTFVIEADCVCVTTGASGTIQGDGYELQGNPTTFLDQTYSLNKSITTVDTTASQAVDCFLTWSANTAGNAVTSTIVDVIWGN